MSKGKKIYFLVLILITILVTTFYFSYAIFSNTQEKHGKLNIVAGTLNYKIESSELDSDSIILGANTSKEIKIKLTSLNEVGSKYELYYTLDKTNDKVSVGYSKDTKDNVLGTIEGSSSKMISIVVRNDSDTSSKVTFKVLGGLVNNELALKDGNSLNKVVSIYYQEEILNGSYPVLKDNLVPVTISDTGVVTKADTTKKWYNYEKKNWANSVILKNSYDSLNVVGKINGVTKKDSYVSFDGEDDYINLGLANYDFKSNITMAIRVKFNNLNTTSNQEFFNNFESAGVGFGLLTNSKLFVQIYIDGVGYSQVYSTDSVKKDKYYTLVLTFDGNTIKFYIDGILNGSVKTSGNLIKASNLPILLGANPQPSNDHMFYSNINVEKAVIYNRTLSEEEIKNSFSSDIHVYSSDRLLKYVDFTNSTPLNNEIISEDNIESYFVWIPKYSYQLFDLGDYSNLTSISDKTQEIKIKFGTGNTSDNVSGECTTPFSNNQGIAGSSGNCKVGDYMTHPAFLAFDTLGLWVGKFETGYDGATTTTAAQVNNVDTSKIVIKPNVYSWRNITVGNMFKNSYDYKRDLDSHMMKNTEWGSVAYLQHSAYGSQASVRINNNSAYITGYAGTEEPTLSCNGGPSIEGNRNESTNLGVDGTYTNNYLNQNSVLASTTGNYSGIYDMSGGAWEYLMGYTTGATTVGSSSNITNLYPNFFTDSTYLKYWDKYTSTVNTNYNNRILGDATGEMGPFGTEKDSNNNTRSKSSWYKDYAYFANFSNPWFGHGGDWNLGSAAGVFAFNDYAGGADTRISYRIVLAPTK